jgi:hypothetical protein
MKTMKTHTSRACLLRGSIGALASLAVIGVASVAGAQTFDPYAGYPFPERAKEDGALDLTGESGTIDFNPRSPTAHPAIRDKDADRDNVFHFTKVVIPQGVTLKMSAKWTNGPVYWMVTGPTPPCDPSPCVGVDIRGTVDLNGQWGHQRTRTTTERVPAVPGPGGFPGGIGGNYRGDSRGAAQPGGGPGGGKAGANAESGWARGATTAGTTQLVPLLGGSGGGGGSTAEFEWWGAGGGAGGGALLISSGQGISIPAPGQILSHGGAAGSQNNGYNGCEGYLGGLGGSGAGGAIRLVAPMIQGDGNVYASYYHSNWNTCSDSRVTGAVGRVRIEAFQNNWKFNLTSYTQGTPLNSFVPTTAPPSIQVTGIGGQTVDPEDITGGFDVADYTIETNNPIEVTIQGRNVPVDTVPKLIITSLDGKDQVIDVPALKALTGQPGMTYSTLMVKFPPGFSRGYVRATWTTTAQ